MLYDFCYLFLFFIFYSFIGYIAEITNCSIIEKKVVLNRGFCLGPYLPIYGVSSVIMVALLERYQHELLTLFVMAAFVCTVMEFVTSYVLEKIFKVRWWDYSDKRFNIEGRVCLANSVLFGLGGIVIVSVINPFLMNIVNSFNHNTIIILGLILSIIFFTDVIITVVTMCQLKIASVKFSKKDATEEVSKIIRAELIKNRRLIRHMLNAFPKIDPNGDEILAIIKRQLEKGYQEYKKAKRRIAK